MDRAGLARRDAGQRLVNGLRGRLVLPGIVLGVVCGAVPDVVSPGLLGLVGTVVESDTVGYKPVSNFGPPLGRISSRSYSRQYEPGQRLEGPAAVLALVAHK